MSNKNSDTTTAIARKLDLTNVGCEELLGSYKGFKFGWMPANGSTRIWGQSKPTAHNASQKELLTWVLARA
jgi:hypothetical protein